MKAAGASLVALTVLTQQLGVGPVVAVGLVAVGLVVAGLVAVHVHRDRALSAELAVETREPRDGPTVLYRHYDSAGALLYVGISNDYVRRCEQHAADKPWWPLVDHTRSTCQTYPTRALAEAAEVRAIRTESPKFNIAHNGRRARRYEGAF
jgi:hypothetical protein